MTQSLQMSPELMRELAHQVTEILIERRARLSAERAWDGEFRQELTARLQEDPPEQGRPPRDVIDRAVRDVLSPAMRLDHPRAFGFVPSEPTWPAILGEHLATGFNINAASWLTASGSSQLEAVVLDWFRRWVGYADASGGVLTSGGSAAALDAFVAAREATGNPARPTLYLSDQGHSAQVRAARIVGIPPAGVRVLPTGADFRLRPGTLASAVEADRAAGCTPIAVSADAGSTSTGAVDPLNDIADYCAAQGIWLHVDAAHGGFAVVTEPGARLLRGIERADSIAIDPHKWFFQPYETGCLLVKDAGTLERAFAIQHDVLQDSVWGANHPNQADRGLQLSRRDRALNPRLAGNRDVPGQHRRRNRPGGAPGAQPACPRPPVLGRSRVPVVDLAPRDGRASDVRDQPLDHLGRRPRNPGNDRANRPGGSAIREAVSEHRRLC